MNALRESLRQTGRDLIQKRLWPVAVVLLVALIAAPMMIGRSSGDAVAPDPVAAAPGGAGATPPAIPASGKSTPTKTKPVKEKSGGKLADPFFDPPSTPEAAEAGAGGGGGSARAVAKSPTGEAAPRPGAESAKGQTGPAAPQAGSPATTAVPKPRVTPRPAAATPTSSYLRTVVRMGSADSGKAFPIARLTPLGGATDPGAVFLGVANAGARYAVFMLGPHATSRGEATCKGGTDCRMIGLRAGQTQVVTVRRANGAVSRITLRVQSIRKVRTSAARARAARARIHADGREAVRDLRRHAASATALRTARYDSRAGLLRAAGADAVKNAAE